jgi:phosphopantetheine adenylyltransferase
MDTSTNSFKISNSWHDLAAGAKLSIDNDGSMNLSSAAWIRLFGPEGGNAGIVLSMAGTDYAQIYATGSNDGGFLVINTGDNGNEPIVFSQTGNERMRIHGNGFVGIGTTTPAFLLDVNGDIRLDSGGAVRFDAPAGGYHGNPTGGIICYMAGSDYAQIYAAGSNDGGYLVINTGDNGNEPIIFQQEGVERMRIAANGYVGIRTNTPIAPLEVAGGFVYSQFYASYMDGNSAKPRVGHGDYDFSIVSRAAILCDTVIFVASDERIKNIKGLSNSAADLQTLRGIEITDYTYRDCIAKGNQTLKKVIAQQVEKVFPQAISKTTDVVPDIYQKSLVKEGWVQLATDLKVGERVKLIDEKAEGIYEVLEVKTDGFRTDFVAEGGKVFVYGREVDDYRSVDYEAIAMLNVSATQQLNRDLETVAAESNDEFSKLRSEIDAKSQTIKQLESRLEKLEARLSNGN